MRRHLEDANIKIASVVSDLLGMSGRTVLQRLIGGETDADRLVARTRGRLKADPDRLCAALEGRIQDHHRFLIQLHLDQISALEQGLRQIDAQLRERLRPFEGVTTRLRTMPGVSHVVAQTLVAEIRVDMRRFPTPGHLRSWVGLCPRLDESAGKRHSTRIRHGAPWLKTVLAQSAWVAVRNRNGYP